MDIFQSIVLGVIEGFTEFLPVSSTAHLVLATHIMGLESTEFVKSFVITIQFGAILSVLVLYWKRFLLDPESLKRVLAAFVPTAALGFILYKAVKGFLMDNQTVIVWSLLLGGLFLIVFELLHREKESAHEDISTIPYPVCISIGLFQALAMVPGVSRSAATIIGGLLLGLKRTTIVEFSFLLAVPTMLAASVLDMAKSAPSFEAAQFGVLAAGFAVSFVTALLSIKFLISYTQKHTFIPFGVYRIAAALLFLSFFI
ncbi:MAG: undecaprenyl-diphosphate phosphatase [Candidatus Margulisiibacteriota bacterium]